MSKMIKEIRNIDSQTRQDYDKFVEKYKTNTTYYILFSAIAEQDKKAQRDSLSQNR
jgi:hypothetical protein